MSDIRTKFMLIGMSGPGRQKIGRLNMFEGSSREAALRYFFDEAPGCFGKYRKEGEHYLVIEVTGPHAETFFTVQQVTITPVVQPKHGIDTGLPIRATL